jgi:hypothetical protein
MIVFVHQPEYIPWLGFFDKLARCDAFVIYDDAQYQHGGFHNRNRIRTAKGWQWITVPIVHGHPQTIKDVRIAGTDWRTKQLSVITQNYQKSPFYDELYPTIKDAINSNHELLIGLNLHLIKRIAGLLDIHVNMVRSSEFPYSGSEKNEKLISICKHMGADTYLCGSGGKTYVNEALFKAGKITLQWHSYQHPTYPQQFEGFQSNMSIIDLLFNLGPKAKEILLTGGVITASKPAHLQLINKALTVGVEKPAFNPLIQDGLINTMGQPP